MREQMKPLEIPAGFLANQLFVYFRIVDFATIDNQIAGGDLPAY